MSQSQSSTGYEHKSVRKDEEVLVSGTSGFTSEVMPTDALSPQDLLSWKNMCETWDELCDPFLSPEFAAAVSSVRPLVSVCVVRHEGRPVAFLPFQFQSRLHKAFGAAERVGGEMNDCFGLVAKPRTAIGSRKLLELAGLQSLLFSHMPVTQRDYNLPGSDVVGSPVIECSPQYWENLSFTNKRFVNDTNRCRRKLETEVGQLRFTADERNFEDKLEELIRLKRLQYTQTGVGDALASEWKRKLLFVLANTRSSTCTGILSVLYAGDTWLASHFGLRSGNLLHYWFPIYNRDYAPYAPGRLLLGSLIEAGEQLNVKVIDQGPGPTIAKRNFSTSTRMFCRGAWYSPGVRSALYRGACSVRWRLNGRLGAASSVAMLSASSLKGPADA